MNRRAAVAVRVEALDVCESFGCVGVIRSARTGRVLRVTERVYPFGFRAQAVEGATLLARDRGYVVEDDDE